MKQVAPKSTYKKIAIDIFELCLNFDIQLQSTWIPREENITADSISQYKDTDDWSIDNETFQYIQQKFGVFTIDRIASELNSKVEVFNSKFYCPNTSAVNAFTCDWGNSFNWLFPPINLIGKAIKHIKYCKALGVLFVPEWKSAYYWPLLTNDGKCFELFVRDFLLLDPFL